MPRPSLVTVYKVFVRPHLDYGDIIYDHAYKGSFHQKLESTQHNAALAKTDAIRVTSIEKFYQELALEYLQKQRWYRNLCYCFKTCKSQSPDFLSQIHIVPII